MDPQNHDRVIPQGYTWILWFCTIFDLCKIEITAAWPHISEAHNRVKWPGSWSLLHDLPVCYRLWSNFQADSIWVESLQFLTQLFGSLYGKGSLNLWRNIANEGDHETLETDSPLNQCGVCYTLQGLISTCRDKKERDDKENWNVLLCKMKKHSVHPPQPPLPVA